MADPAHSTGIDQTVEQIPTALAGRVLARWCPDGRPCHSDVLLEAANPQLFNVLPVDRSAKRYLRLVIEADDAGGPEFQDDEVAMDSKAFEAPSIELRSGDLRASRIASVFRPEAASSGLGGLNAIKVPTGIETGLPSMFFSEARSILADMVPKVPVPSVLDPSIKVPVPSILDRSFEAPELALAAETNASRVMQAVQAQIEAEHIDRLAIRAPDDSPKRAAAAAELMVEHTKALLDLTTTAVAIAENSQRESEQVAKFSRRVARASIVLAAAGVAVGVAAVFVPLLLGP